MVKTLKIIIGMSLMSFLSSCGPVSDLNSGSSFRMKICQNDYAYSLIDTSVVYLHIETNGSSNFVDAKLDTVKIESLGNIIKFYNSGRVALFVGFKDQQQGGINTDELTKGIYCINEQRSEMEFRYYHVQSGWFSSRQSFRISGDTLISQTLPSPQSRGDLVKYVKRKMPKELLIFNPDW